MSIFFQGCGRNLEQLEEKPTQAEEEDVQTVLPVLLSETGRKLVPCKTGQLVIPKRVHTGASVAVCPWEASITCPPPPGTGSSLLPSTWREQQWMDRRGGTETMTQNQARTAGTGGPRVLL